ncbi:uncharacterized protein LOC132303370 [Cornus florida]|uniref:uncharacterized protein LOC132303370 n=1 Tax=Cornus florida TaxID=4283 RepID=UPI002899421D|nr:uncharacterized protein LOC132303370 [Cornus florida]
MKDLSFFLLKNSLGAKMRKGFKSFCNNDGSTSTLNQRREIPLPIVDPLDNTGSEQSPPTLEEMIIQLELEEKMAVRKAKLDEYGEVRRRMSCVNNSDILRSARNALNQYPRFSLDGKDAMYQSSFRNLPPINTAGGRKSICCEYGLRKGMYKDGSDSKGEKVPCLPQKLAGERVVWCKPGVVAKLMGLEAMPVSIGSKRSKERLSSAIRMQNLKRRTERHDKDRRVVMDLNGCGERKRGIRGSCSTTEYCVMKPIAVETAKDEAGWPIRRFL